MLEPSKLLHHCVLVKLDFVTEIIMWAENEKKGAIASKLYFSFHILANLILILSTILHFYSTSLFLVLLFHN